MKPVKYEPKKDKELKPVPLDLRKDEDGILALVAVGPTEDDTIYLLRFKEKEIESVPLAKYGLDSLGYDTSFCKWDSDGAVVLN